MQIGYLDGPRLRRSLMAACEHAQRQRGELNRINVFPVPDGDTGTNLALTVRAISDHLRRNRDRDVSVVAREAAQAAVLGARGNCGMMLSHFLLGFAEDVGDRARLTTEEFGQALASGVRTLYAALENPVEGTILTVMRETAEAAADKAESDFVPFVKHLVDEAQESLARTPDLLPVLKQAGVVDAGAKGFVSLLEGAALFIHGDPLVALSSDEGWEEAAVAMVDYPAAEEQYRYCTEALVRGPSLPTQGSARAFLREKGDSLIVIRSEDVLKVHIHTDDPEEIFVYLRGLGTLVTHKAEDMEAQHQTVGRAADQHVNLARRAVTVFTDSASDLPEEIVRAHGIHVTPLLLIDGDETYRDGVDITAAEFHDRLVLDDVLPTTSQPAPADFLDTLSRAAEDGEAVLGVMLGSSLSGTLRSAQAAAGQFHGADVHFMDTLGITLLEGLLVLKACELAELGTPPAEIVQELERIRAQSGVLFTVETLDRLVASGRIGKGRAMLGSVLSVKPILEVDTNGKIVPVGKAIGQKRAQTALLDELAARIPKDAKVRFGIPYVGSSDIVEQVSGALRTHYGYDVEILSAPATPVIATHLGFGAWGVAYMVED